MTEPTKERCAKRIPYGPLSHRPCTRWGVVSRDGKLYCRQHDPEAVKAKRDARDAAWNAEWERKRLAAFSKARQDSIDQHRLATWGQLRDALNAIEIGFGGQLPRHIMQQVDAALEAAKEE